MVFTLAVVYTCMSREPDAEYAAQNEPKGSSESSIILDIFLGIKNDSPLMVIDCATRAP